MTVDEEMEEREFLDEEKIKYKQYKVEFVKNVQNGVKLAASAK